MADACKVPKLPGSKKRQLPDAPTPDMLKRIRMDTDSLSAETSSTRNGDAEYSKAEKGKARSVTIEDVDEDASEQHSDFAPGGDADYFAEEDEEGRFFGGGLTDEQKTILNIFDNAENGGIPDGSDDLSLTSIRKILLRFERAAKKNQDQRSKYPNDPTKFIDSEADLDMAIKALLPLAQVSTIAYPELLRSGTADALVDLLGHENADIVIDVVEVIHELTDEDTGNEEEEEEESREEVLKELIEGLLAKSILELLVQNLVRLNEKEESDRQGVFENILGFNPDLSTQLVSKTNILTWVLERITVKTHDENRGYAAELLSILLQNNHQNRLALGDKSGVDILLKLLSQYRQRDPADADEVEFMENIFDSLCSALIEPEIKESFLKEEGVDLMVLIMKVTWPIDNMLREKKQSRSLAIKVLDHALSGTAGTSNCETFVEALGLKTLFSAFMGKVQKQKNGATTLANEDTSHTLGIMASLFSNLASESKARIRLLAKFVENNYEKVDRLLEIREQSENRLKAAEREIEQERRDLIADGVIISEDDEESSYLRKLDSGLFVLQTVDYILGWICMEDDGIRNHVTKMLDRKNKSLKDIVSVLTLYRENVGEDETRTQDDISPTQQEILDGLITFLSGC
ncbi:hypothetical protein Clacol_001768 [Clathrus columnatus]|uniref:Beta-catenin-like protein 1 N-terminal domain-containing protein n=1 Tax=Clathrus columnatus TaxID=1419009 RepID=A0AAV5A3H9_9AGAM|nr:hypothetical protein Clacol_001768 [Clathrus columnatus]